MRVTRVVAALRALVLILAGLALSSCGDKAGGGGACGGVDELVAPRLARDGLDESGLEPGVTDAGPEQRAQRLTVILP